MLVEYFIAVLIERNKSIRYQRFPLLQARPSWKGYPDSQRLNIIVLLNYQFIIIMQNKAKSNMVVIINADDFGYHQSIDRGILQLIEQHHISSTSAIVNAPDIDNAARQIKELITKDQSFLTSLSIGLHFNITQGEPLSQSILLSKLVANGEFIGKPKIFDVAKQANSFSNEQIQEELLAQINKFIDYFGRKPSHIDGHNHVHLIPTIAPIIAKTMDSLGIYKTRIPLERLDKISLPINNMFLEYADNAKEAYTQRGIIYCNEFVGLQSFGNLSSTLLLKAIQNQQLQHNGSVEMMCHPGYPALQGSQWIKSEDRLKEKEQLSSKQFRLLSQKYKQSNYHHLVQNKASKGRKTLICLTQQNRKYFMQIDLKMKFWIKDERIQNKINKIDLASVINSFSINFIVQIYSNQPQKYISQIAQSLSLPLYLINSEETKASQLSELILKVVPNK